MRLYVNGTHSGVKGFEVHTCIRSKYFPISTHEFVIDKKVLIVSYCLKCMEGVALNVILHGKC